MFSKYKVILYCKNRFFKEHIKLMGILTCFLKAKLRNLTSLVKTSIEIIKLFVKWNKFNFKMVHPAASEEGGLDMRIYKE